MKKKTLIKIIAGALLGGTIFTIGISIIVINIQKPKTINISPTTIDHKITTSSTVPNSTNPNTITRKAVEELGVERIPTIEEVLAGDDSSATTPDSGDTTNFLGENLQVISGTLWVNKQLTLGSHFRVKGFTTLDGTLVASKDVYLGTLGENGYLDRSLGGDDTTTTIYGTLDLSNAYIIGLPSGSNSGIQNTPSTSTGSFSSLNVLESTTLRGTLQVTDSTQFNNKVSIGTSGSLDGIYPVAKEVDLSVSGNTFLEGNVYIGDYNNNRRISDLVVTGNVTIGDLRFNPQSGLRVLGSVNVEVSVDAKGQSSFAGGLIVGPSRSEIAEGSLVVTKDSILEGNLEVKQSSTLLGDVVVGVVNQPLSTADLRVTGSTILDNKLHVKGLAILNGNTDIKGRLDVTQKAVFNDELNVKGKGIVEGSFQAKTGVVIGDYGSDGAPGTNDDILGDLTVTGATIFWNKFITLGSTNLFGTVVVGSLGLDDRRGGDDWNKDLPNDLYIVGDLYGFRNAEFNADLHVDGDTTLKGDVTIGSLATDLDDPETTSTTTILGNLNLENANVFGLKAFTPIPQIFSGAYGPDNYENGRVYETIIERTRSPQSFTINTKEFPNGANIMINVGADPYGQGSGRVSYTKEDLDFIVENNYIDRKISHIIIGSYTRVEPEWSQWENLGIGEDDVAFAVGTYSVGFNITITASSTSDDQITISISSPTLAIIRTIHETWKPKFDDTSLSQDIFTDRSKKIAANKLGLINANALIIPIAKE